MPEWKTDHLGSSIIQELMHLLINTTRLPGQDILMRKFSIILSSSIQIWAKFYQNKNLGFNLAINF